MSQNDRLNLIEEVQKSTQPVINEMKIMSDTVIEKVDQMELMGDNIRILCAKIQDRAEKIERYFKEFKERETNALSQDLENIYQEHKGE